MASFVRAGALAAAALLSAGAAAGCGSGSPDAGSPPSASSTPASPSKASPSKTSPSKTSPSKDMGGSGEGGAQPALPAALTGQQLDWKRCAAPRRARGSGAQAPGSQWQCATLTAPLDYSKPDGETMGIALIRSKATDSDRRLGSLLFNFGGPGGSGVAGLPGFGTAFTALHERYDLVSFDPRGVAESSAVVCQDDRQADASFLLDSTPDTPAEEKAYLDDSAAFGAGCLKRSGKVLPYVGTSSAARDMDLIRQVLGDKKLNYFGFSYGTELGGTYAHLFPKNVGRMALDAVVDPSADFVHHSRNQTLGFQRALDNYFKSTGTTPAAGTARVARLLDRLDKKRLTARSGRPLTQSLAVTGILQTLYGEDSWPMLTRGLREAENGDGTTLLALAETYNNRDQEGHYSTDHHAQRAISCADAKGRVSGAEVRKKHLADFKKVSPVFGPYLAWDLAGWCASWPVDGEHETPEVGARGADPVLVVGGKGDPATPYEGSLRMVDELGKGVGVQITYEGEGHGAYLTGNSCIARAVNPYFLDGKVPADGTTCS
ncbi:alpha/beta hydrolase [Streptomyces spiramyceticus]|uniref:alpha/beta hydrolase n=1 Tax=Streptomyces spiramyceticus TaxID=299717 RepID=UPI00237BE26C|nr:alpha/beta hydrolase [Streptomyces spiramyceticus]